MAEIIESSQNHVPSNGKVNAALVTGIIGTALGALNMGIGSSLFNRSYGRNRNWGNDWGRNGHNDINDYESYRHYDHNYINIHPFTSLTPFAQFTPFTPFGPLYGNSGNWGNSVYDLPINRSAGITNEELYLERKSFQDTLDREKEYYQGQMNVNERLVNAFFDSYKRDVDNSFMLYKSQRDHDDILAKKIDDVDKKVDIMAAIRPYQDALINNKIQNAELMAQYNLDRKTCRMITGQLVLPSTPEITGYGSYPNFPYTKS